MGKNLVVAAFLVTVALSLYVFFARDESNLRERMSTEDARKEPRLIVEDFTVYRYAKHTVTATLSAKLANFVEPNVLEMYGNIRGLRHNAKQREYVLAESATTYFVGRGIAQLMKDATIIKSELENDVRVGLSQNTLSTQFAEYLAREGVLRSDLPVRIDSPKGQFDGDRGFVYEIANESMTINGPMRGVLQGEDLNDYGR